MKTAKKFWIITFAAISVLLVNCNAGDPKPEAKGNIIHLTKATFKSQVFDYEKNKQWKYEGNKPAIIDFYADWCGPCRMLAPVMDEIAKEYAGKIIVYKVDTEKERELAMNLGISSLPTLVFIPVNGKPQATMGALPKAELVKIINEVLLNESAKK
ncbi:MAG TPA: thioredoxin [Bacteroidales bacterium]|nr:thioredoxin [Bacteroidales bacterium]HOK98717.1 thioredoxin [Bacteroidales bacterium]HPO65615.1 thioredoxin [Bacteroidales bacterium]